jgi:hypothetical protein
MSPTSSFCRWIAPIAMALALCPLACGSDGSGGDGTGGGGGSDGGGTGGTGVGGEDAGLDAAGGTTQPDTGLPDGSRPEDTGADVGQPDTALPDGDTPDSAPDAGQDADVAPFICMNDGFAATSVRAELAKDSNGDRVWLYDATNGDTSSFEALSVQIYDGAHPHTSPGTYTITAKDTSYKSCANCFLFHTGCWRSLGTLQCEKVLMPRVGSTYTINNVGFSLGSTLDIDIEHMEFQEVTIDPDTYATTPVAGGDTWCLDDVNASATLVDPAFVDMPQPTGLSCEYPAPPYYFLGPEPGDTSIEPQTVPPMGWPGAFFGGLPTGFDLAQFKCDHPEIKTLFIMVGAGWCSACKDFFTNTFCKAGGLEEQLHALNAEILYVIIDNNVPGTPATNVFANAKVNSYGCHGGYRISDTDNTAGFRVIYHSQMYAGIPWAAAVRMSDMKLTHEQSDTEYLDYVAIATANNQ